MNKQDLVQLRKKEEERIIEHAWKDSSFLERLILNPHEALKELNLQVPDTISVNVIQEKKDNWCIIIPSQPPSVRELTEEEIKIIEAGCCHYLTRTGEG